MIRITFACLILSALSVVMGCGSMLPTPAEPKPSTTPKTGSSTTETTAAAGLPALPEDAPELMLEEAFELLGLDAFDRFSAKDPGQLIVWEPVGNGFNCWGKPRGYLYSKQSYENFTLKLEYRFRRPADLKDDAEFKGNTGVMLFINPPHKQWPASLEVQGKYSEMAMIKANGGAAMLETTDVPEARTSSRKPVGEWNHLEVTARDGAIVASINGTRVCESKAGELKSGALGFQAEDFEVHFRNVRVRRD